MKMTKEMMLLLNDTEAVRILTTVSENGIPHSIAVNTAMAPESNLISIADIRMKTTAQNLKKNTMVSILTVKEYKSHLVKALVKDFQTEGILFDAIKDEAKKKGLPCRGLWLFEPVEVIDQSLEMTNTVV